MVDSRRQWFKSVHGVAWTETYHPVSCAPAGRSADELRGTDFLAFTHPDDIAPCGQQLLRLLAGEVDSVSFDKRYLRPNGLAIWARATVSLMQAATAPGEAQLVR